MIKIYVYSSLLSTLSVVEMKPLNINGRVGESVEIKCSDWGSWTNVNYKDKYFCKSPCTEYKHIIIKAAFKKSNFDGRIQLINIPEGLFVTFTNLQKSDSGTYYCGAERIGHDSYIEVNLKVTEASKTTTKTIIIHSTPSFAVSNSSTMSSDGSDVITDTSVSYTIHSTTTTTSATQGTGSVPHLVTGATVILTILMVLLMLMRKMRVKHLKVEDYAREDVEYDEIRPEHQQTVSRPAGVSTLYDSVDAESLYANCSYHRDIELAELAECGACAESRVTDPQCDLVYSVAQLPKEQIEPTGQSESNQSNENDCLYSMAQLPQAS